MTMEELKSALLRLDMLRKEREKKIAQADEIEENCLSIGVSHVFDNIGASHQRSRHSPQERMAEAVDLRKSALDDLVLIQDTSLLLEDEIDRIKDPDVRWVIGQKYLHGWSLDEIASLYEEEGASYVYEIEDQFFRS